jgi:hypothetical protein
MLQDEIIEMDALPPIFLHVHSAHMQSCPSPWTLSMPSPQYHAEVSQYNTPVQNHALSQYHALAKYHALA